MAWQDRDYYGGENPRGYLSSPAGLLGLSVPFGTWGPVRVRLHFWLLLSILFICVPYLEARNLTWLSLHVGFFLIALMLHEFGHRVFAQWVDGSHDEFMLWPAGGMIPVNVPQTPLATFVGFVGGLAANLAGALVCTAFIWFQDRQLVLPSLNPLQVFGGVSVPISPTASFASNALIMFMALNMMVFFAALLPYYWFDGASILQSILWPWTGLRQAINVTCIVGMVLAVPMFLLAVAGTNLLGMIFWALLFASAYNRRRELKMEPVGGYEDALAQSLAIQRGERRTRKPSRITRWAEERKAASQQKLQQQVDQILEKVARDGMHSLTNAEKSTLERASRELKDRDTR